MLKGLDTKLNADLLYTLCSMGHGDMIVVVDRNFPSVSVAKKTVVGSPITIASSNVSEAVGSILSVFPLDEFVENPFMRMEVTDDPNSIPEVQQEVLKVLDGCLANEQKVTAIDRFAFYDLAKNAFAVISTQEPRFFGCFAMQKGVLPESD